MSSRNHTQREKGQSLVELAVVVVILLILVAGIVDLGRMIFLFQSMRDAAQEGAAYASINPVECTATYKRIMDNLPPTANDYLVSININGGECDNAVTYCSGQVVEVSVSTQFDVTMPLLSAFTGTEIPLTASIRDTVIRPYCPTPSP